MIVVTDASPLHYLVLIGSQSLLETIYKNVVCPQTVLLECVHPHAPEALRKWAANTPAWLHIIADSPRTLPGFAHLDPGEQAAIQTAVSLGAPIVLMDEKKGRLAAQSCGLVTVGFLGVLLQAARLRCVDFDTAVEQLTQGTNFRVSEAVLDRARTILRG